MKLLLIRHGDPDYENDTLTPKGHREAALLAERIAKMDITDFYVSPLGRARDTAAYTLKKMNRQAEVCEWLREFQAPIRRPDFPDRKSLPWDWLPADWSVQEQFFTPDNWSDNAALAEGRVREEYDRVTGHLDRLLAAHGYVREGRHYRTERPNHDTLAFFSHFGAGCVLLSHLLNVSPMVLWHGLCASPTSVSTVVTEERRPGIAYFRMRSYGDISHLYAEGEKPSSSALFCECFDDVNERHD